MRSNNRSRASASVLNRIALSRSLALSFCSWFMNEPIYLDRLAAAVRAGHRRASEPRLAPALSLPATPPPFSSRQLHLKIFPPVSRRRRRYLNGFWGVAEGVLPPCRFALKQNQAIRFRKKLFNFNKDDPNSKTEKLACALTSPSPSPLRLLDQPNLPNHHPLINRFAHIIDC